MIMLSKPATRIIKTASFLGLVQGLTWMVLALICIGIYFDQPIEHPTCDTYMKCFQLALYFILFYDPSGTIYEDVFNPHTLVAFSFIYVFASFAWWVTSIRQLQSLKKVNVPPIQVLRQWVFITGFVSIVDFLLVVLIATEFDRFCMRNTIVSMHEELCTTLYIPILVIVARGFTLWFINVIFCFILFRIARNLSKPTIQRCPSHIPRPTLQMPANQPAYGVPQNGPRSPGYNPNQPQASPFNTSIPQSPTSSYFNPQQNAQFARGVPPNAGPQNYPHQYQQY